MRIISSLIISIFILTGCGIQEEQVSNQSGTSYEINPDHELITEIWKNRILAGTTYYEVTEDTKVRNSEGEKLTIDDLKQGDLITLETIGIIMESYPGQTEATEVVLQTDKESLDISRSIRHFIDNQKIGAIIGLRMKEVSENTIIVGFKEFDIRSDKIYEVAINRNKNEFEVTEIPNETVLDQERRHNTALKVGTIGTTAGHITEIYENGFRVDMVDFTLSDDAVLRVDSGKEMKKEAFKIGDFVSVDYSNFKGKEIIKEATINQLTLLKSEERPGVQRWIKSVMEGPLYKDPVIMHSHIGRDEESYTIQVADLQDDTWDTFEITYDFKTKKQTVERIVHVPKKRDVSPYEGITNYEIIQAIDNDELFISRAKYAITPETKMETSNGERITINDLEIGSLVKLEHEPTLKFAGTETGKATKVSLRNDDLYQNIGDSIRHFLTQQQVGAIHSTIISGINDTGIILKFTDEKGKKYKAKIDRETNEFTVHDANDEKIDLKPWQ